MDPSQRSYDQPEKQRARWLALCHAVESLTTHRGQSPVVTIDHFDRILKYACDQIELANQRDYTCFPEPHEQVSEAAAEFRQLHEARVGNRSARDLSVLFLAGPEPANDLRTLMELGISPQNIWAVEADDQAYEAAVESISDEGLPIKLYKGGLQQFFEIVPQQFDIVYFDACSPLLGGKPGNTLLVLRELFLRQRLSPLSVLITNFSEANLDGKHSQEWAARIGTWLFMRDGYEDFEDDYFQHVEDTLEDSYSEFITRFVVELGGLLLPWWRVATLPGAKGEYFAKSEAIKAATKKKDASRSSMGAMFFQDSFPAFLRILDVAEEKLPKGDVLRQHLLDHKLQGTSLAEAIRLAYYLRNAGDAVFSETAEANRDACNPALIEVLDSFQWIDQQLRLFCDVPGPHLLSDLLLGLYGYPYHPNTKRLRRWKYTAAGKNTPMYLDAFVFDQARYFYDLVPTLPFVVDNLRFGQQLVLRSCMDSIGRHNWAICPEWFYAASLASIGKKTGFTRYEAPARETIVASDNEEDDLS